MSVPISGGPSKTPRRKGRQPLREAIEPKLDYIDGPNDPTAGAADAGDARSAPVAETEPGSSARPDLASGGNSLGGLVPGNAAAPDDLVVVGAGPAALSAGASPRGPSAGQSSQDSAPPPSFGAEASPASERPLPHEAGDQAFREALRPASRRAGLFGTVPDRLLRKNWFSDLPDKGLFLLFVVPGFIVIFATKTIGIPGLWPALISVVVLGTYAYFSYRIEWYRLKPDSLGDNCYYMGFLFTLASLSAALMTLYRDTNSGRDDLLQQLIGGFGIALLSTIAGIALRVFFMQMRHEIADLEDQLRSELQGAATLLKDQLAIAVMDLENLRLRTRQVMDQNLDDAAKGFAGVAENLVVHVASSSDLMANNAARVASEIGRLVDKVDQIQVPPDLLVRQVESVRTMINGLAATLEATAAAGNQQVADAKQRIDGFTSAMNAVAVAATERQVSMDQASKVLAEFITRSVNVAVYSDVEAAVARFGAGVDTAVGKLSAVSDRLEHYSGAIEKAASQVDESVASTTRAKTVISEDLAQSTDALHKLQETLADVADGLVARVTGAPSRNAASDSTAPVGAEA